MEIRSQALVEADEQIEKTKKNLSANLIERGNIYLSEKKYKEALQDYEAATNYNIHNTLAYVKYAMVLYEMNEHQEGLIFLNTLLVNKNLKIDKSSIYFRRGMANNALNLNDVALFDYTKSIEIDSNNSAAFCNRCIIYFEMKQFDKALSDINNAIKINNRSMLAYNNRGYLYYNLNKIPEAIADFSKAISSQHDYEQPQKNLRELLLDPNVDFKGIRKPELLSAINLLPELERIPILEKCVLDPKENPKNINPLNTRLWKQNRSKPCSINAGQVKIANDRLIELRKKYQLAMPQVPVKPNYGMTNWATMYPLANKDDKYISEHNDKNAAMCKNTL